MNVRRFLTFGVLFVLAPILSANRIVTLAPALTEIVYALGQGSSIVGNTRYCDFPPQANGAVRVGGLLDLNLERLVSLEPDLIILYPESRERLIPVFGEKRLLAVPHSSLTDLFFSIEVIAKALGCEKTGQQLISDIQAGLKTVAARSRTVQRRSALLIAGRESDQLRNLYLIGKNDFINEILDLCGGVNAYQGKLAYPLVSVESIAAMNPHTIIELSAHYEGIAEAGVRRAWAGYGWIAAVRENRIHFIHENFWLRPGPRIVQIATSLFTLLHPDAK